MIFLILIIFKEKLLDIYEEGYYEIIIDFSNISSIDSSGLGKILLFHKKLKGRDGELKIRNNQVVNIEDQEGRFCLK